MKVETSGHGRGKRVQPVQIGQQLLQQRLRHGAGLPDGGGAEAFFRIAETAHQLLKCVQNAELPALAQKLRIGRLQPVQLRAAACLRKRPELAVKLRQQIDPRADGAVRAVEKARNDHFVKAGIDDLLRIIRLDAADQEDVPVADLDPGHAGQIQQLPQLVIVCRNVCQTGNVIDEDRRLRGQRGVIRNRFAPAALRRDGRDRVRAQRHRVLRQLQRVPLKRLADMDDGPASGGPCLRDGQLRRPATLGERQTAAVSGAAADIKAGDGRAQQPRQIFLQAVVIDALIRCAGRNNGADDPAKRCKISQIRFLPALSRAALQRRRSDWSTACR